ncbi:MAG: radical SAM protein [Candidatus Aenigmarchaeota archaeon]|nr:radical SAM protein [Candidatus Aenigmarchaeota archaeon]
MFVFEKDGKVLLRKTCKEHGTIEDVYWGDYQLFVKAKRFEVKGRGLENPHNPKEHPVCPRDCGLCSMHETHSGLTNIVITNRCDLTCWYCFFYAEKAGYIYEPTMEELRKMVRMIAQEKPIGGNAIQLTGGNPELRDDLPEIIQMIKEEGVDHIQLNTNATYRLWKDVEFMRRVREAGVNTIYFSFDGVTPKTNPKNFWEVPNVMKNAREAGLGIVLVPTVINTVNDHEVGDILKFAVKNIDIIRGVNYQPVSLVGRMPTSERNRFRITIPDVIKRLEDQCGIPREAFYPVPCTTILSNFVEALAGRPKYELSINPACGMATYLFKEGDRLIPITDFVDVDGLFEYIKEKTAEIREGKNKYWIVAKMLKKLGSFIDKEKGPKDIDLAKIIFNVMLKHDYKSLGVFHKKSLFIGMMHFQDLYNWDIQRIKKCDIHYATPDGVIPFCTFNVIPQWYRDKIQKQYGLTIEEWQKRTGVTLKEGYHKRDPKFMRTLPKSLLDLPVPSEAELAILEAARTQQVEVKPQAMLAAAA